MARGSDAAESGATSANNNAQSLYSTLAPQLETEAITPAGMGPQAKAAANTAAQQSAGGSQAAAVGQGALNAARTRNAGGANAAVSDAARSAGEHLSQAALGTELEDAQLKQHQQQAGLGGLQSLQESAQGVVAPDVNANTEAADQSWDWAKYILDPALTGASKVAAAKLGQPQQ